MEAVQEQTKCFPADVLELAERWGLADRLPDVIAMSREIFGSSPQMRVMIDPEIPDYYFLIVDVEVSDAVEEVLRKCRYWDRQMIALLAGSPHTICLFPNFAS